MTRKTAEQAVCVKPSELRVMLAHVGLKDYRADAAVRLLAFMGTLTADIGNAAASSGEGQDG